MEKLGDVKQAKSVTSISHFPGGGRNTRNTNDHIHSACFHNSDLATGLSNNSNECAYGIKDPLTGHRKWKDSVFPRSYLDLELEALTASVGARTSASGRKWWENQIPTVCTAI